MTKNLSREWLEFLIYLRQWKEMQKKCISKIIKLALPDNLKNQRFEKAICHRENIGIRSTYAFIALPDTNLKKLVHIRTRHEDIQQTYLLGPEYL